ncbi:hypothetical protein [Flaviflexus ciconiae]|uniref:hypothetical protein n=1 Tax=Flaviflexus ciconiae TaxID=2496867 RepID=UPI0013E0C7AB|nr:hypothetical protein [Flaviflexus ciconiae]
MTYFLEKLTPKASVLISAAVIAGMLGLLGLPFSLTATYIAIVALAIIVPFVLWAMSPRSGSSRRAMDRPGLSCSAAGHTLTSPIWARPMY